MKALLRSAKFKITALILLITAIISTAVSGTIAFFTDSKESIGIYTAGNVYIEVTEAATVPMRAETLSKIRRLTEFSAVRSRASGHL